MCKNYEDLNWRNWIYDINVLIRSAILSSGSLFLLTVVWFNSYILACQINQNKHGFKVSSSMFSQYTSVPDVIKQIEIVDQSKGNPPFSRSLLKTEIGYTCFVRKTISFKVQTLSAGHKDS